jgi:hypothetical protein
MFVRNYGLNTSQQHDTGILIKNLSFYFVCCADLGFTIPGKVPQIHSVKGSVLLCMDINKWYMYWLLLHFFCYRFPSYVPLGKGSTEKYVSY